jgi:hypothetical protein
LLGQSLAATGGNFGSFGAATNGGITILDDRNDVALSELQNTLNNPNAKKISIFYGAAHMSGLEQGVIDLGFSKESESWLVAWQSQ